MEKYMRQLLSDIAHATENVDWPYYDGPHPIQDWISDEEEDKTAPRRPLEEWTGISKAQLPPEGLLTDEQINRLLSALEKMLQAYNWLFVTQIKVPERIQYEAIRDNFGQEAIIKRWHMGFFEYCKPGTPHGQCAFGEYCHCRLFAEMLADMVDEELSPEEERARELEMEINYLKRKYGSRWMRYYPYHLDPDYDDEDGNPYDYGFGEDERDDDGDDDWWRR